MKKRLISMMLGLALLVGLLPCGALAAGTGGRTPIYIGYGDVDYMAEEILKEIDTAGKSAEEQIRAVYDWIIYNCDRDSWDGVYHFTEEELTSQTVADFTENANAALDAGQIVLRQEFEDAYTYDEETGYYFMSYDSNYYIANFAYEMMVLRAGNCAHYSALLAVLLGHLGFDCRLIDGDFINRGGSTVEHKWNYVLVDGQYYWLDVRIDHSMYTSTGSIGYYYFMEPSTTVWAEQHDWDHTYSDWLAASAADVQTLYDLLVQVTTEGPWSRCSDWAREQMEEAGERGLIPDSLYAADLTQPISREEFAAVAVNLYEALSGQSAPHGEDPFTDTDDYDTVCAYTLGVVRGSNPEGTIYSPDEPLTREQAVTMLGRVCELVMTGQVGDGSGLAAGTSELSMFTDGAAVSSYAADYVRYLVSTGAINGMGGAFLPQDSMTREQAIKVALEVLRARQ